MSIPEDPNPKSASEVVDQLRALFEKTGRISLPIGTTSTDLERGPGWFSIDTEPPAEIVEAAQRLSDYFAARGFQSWEFMGLAERTAAGRYRYLAEKLGRWKNEALVMLGCWEEVAQMAAKDPRVTIGDSLVRATYRLVCEGLLAQFYHQAPGGVVRLEDRFSGAALEAAKGACLSTSHAEMTDKAQTLTEDVRDLHAALAGLLDEYEDKRGQWGSEYLWQKHEDPTVPAKAREVLERIKPRLQS